MEGAAAGDRQCGGGPAGAPDPDAMRRLRLGLGGAGDTFLSAPPGTQQVIAVLVHSRTRSGPTAFGLLGRVVLTVVVVGVALLTVNAVTVLGLVIVVPVLLRGIWHRERQPTPALRDQRSRPRY